MRACSRYQVSAPPPKALSSRIAICGEIPAWPFTRSESCLRLDAQTSRRLRDGEAEGFEGSHAARRAQDGEGSSWSCSSSLNDGRLIVHIGRMPVFETEDDPPVAVHCNRPVSRLAVPSGDGTTCSRAVPSRSKMPLVIPRRSENSFDLVGMVRQHLSSISTVIELTKALVTKPPYHMSGVTYRLQPPGLRDIASCASSAARSADVAFRRRAAVDDIEPRGTADIGGAKEDIVPRLDLQPQQDEDQGHRDEDQGEAKPRLPTIGQASARWPRPATPRPAAAAPAVDRSLMPPA